MRFLHFDRLPDGQIKDSKVLRVYVQLLQKAREALGIDPSEDVCPHNFILTKRWMMIVPKRNDKFHDITANAARMVGSVFLWSKIN